MIPATFSNTPFSIVARLEISKISLEDAGEYECFGEAKDNTSVSEKVYFTVAGIILGFILTLKF